MIDTSTNIKNSKLYYVEVSLVVLVVDGILVEPNW